MRGKYDTDSNIRKIGVKYLDDKKSNEGMRKISIKKLGKQEGLEYENDFCKIEKKRDISKFINKDLMLMKGSIPRINPYILSCHTIRNFPVLVMDSMRMYIEGKGYFKKISKDELKQKIFSSVPKKYLPFMKSYEIEDCARLIQINPDINIDISEVNIKHHKYINCLNGVIHINKDIVEQHDQRKWFTSCINCNYLDNSDIENSYFMDFISTVTENDRGMINMIRQIMGYCLSNYNNAKKAFILYGESNSGKSVFLKLLSIMCGEENVSNIPLQLLDDEKYTAELFDKTLNICNELPDTKLKDVGIFKSLVSESDKVIARPLYSQPFSFYNKAKLIFATNNLPQIGTSLSKDNSAFFNRVIIIPFNKSIPEGQQDKNLIKKLIKEKDRIFTWAIGGLYQYRDNGFNFDVCSKSLEVMRKYRQSQDIVNTFIENECVIDSSKYIHKYKLEEAYLNFCEDNGYECKMSDAFKDMKNILLNKYKCSYSKINKDGKSRYGFRGIGIKESFS